MDIFRGRLEFIYLFIYLRTYGEAGRMYLCIY